MCVEMLLPIFLTRSPICTHDRGRRPSVRRGRPRFRPDGIDVFAEGVARFQRHLLRSSSDMPTNGRSAVMPVRSPQSSLHSGSPTRYTRCTRLSSIRGGMPETPRDRVAPALGNELELLVARVAGIGERLVREAEVDLQHVEGVHPHSSRARLAGCVSASLPYVTALRGDVR